MGALLSFFAAGMALIAGKLLRVHKKTQAATPVLAHS
jgi:hypothetical protein